VPGALSMLLRLFPEHCNRKQSHLDFLSSSRFAAVIGQ
jgi:hypothetical protein